MTQVSPTMQISSPNQRPKGKSILPIFKAFRPSDIPLGILKNSFRRSPPARPDVPSPEQAVRTSPLAHTVTAQTASSTPEQDLTLQNTLQNAGHRRNSSMDPRVDVSRRQSSNAGLSSVENGDENIRLRWDEANLYLTEQEKSSTMKIDEPKTPYAKRYEPDEDEEEMRTLDAQELKVDELDKIREGRRSQRTKEAEIPGLDIGEPEEDVSVTGGEEEDRIQRLRSASGSAERSGSSSLGRTGSVKGEKSVVVDDEAPDGKGHDGNVRHKDFEEMRKKHYEMKDVKGLLGSVVPILDRQRGVLTAVIGIPQRSSKRWMRTKTSRLPYRSSIRNSSTERSDCLLRRPFTTGVLRQAVACFQ